MPIGVVAKLDRESGVYLAGETIECKVCPWIDLKVACVVFVLQIIYSYVIQSKGKWW